MSEQRLTDEEREQAAQAVEEAVQKVKVFDYVDAYELAVELRKRGWRFVGDEQEGS